MHYLHVISKLTVNSVLLFALFLRLFLAILLTSSAYYPRMFAALRAVSLGWLAVCSYHSLVAVPVPLVWPNPAKHMKTDVKLTEII